MSRGARLSVLDQLKEIGEISFNDKKSIRETQQRLSVSAETVDALDCTYPAEWLNDKYLWDSLIRNGQNALAGGRLRRIFVFDPNPTNRQEYEKSLATVLKIHHRLGIEFGLVDRNVIKSPLIVDQTIYNESIIWEEVFPGNGMFRTLSNGVDDALVSYSNLWTSTEIDAKRRADLWLESKQNLVDIDLVRKAELEAKRRWPVELGLDLDLDLKYKIRPDINIQLNFEGNVQVDSDFGEKTTVLSMSEEQKETLLFLNRGESVSTGTMSLQQVEALSFLLDNGWVVTDTETEQVSAYERQESYFECLIPDQSAQTTQSTVANSRVAIVGCGGVGSNFGLLLAMAGVKNFLVVDPDSVELSNLNRQIPFTFGNSVGQNKVDCLSNLLSTNFLADVESHKKDFAESLQAIEAFDPNIVAVAADHPSISSVIKTSLLLPKRLPLLITGGYFGPRSFVGPLFLTNRPCESCVDRVFFGDQSREVRNVGGTIGPIAVHAAAESAAVALHHLLGVLPEEHHVHWGVVEFNHRVGQSKHIRIDGCSQCLS